MSKEPNEEYWVCLSLADKLLQNNKQTMYTNIIIICAYYKDTSGCFFAVAHWLTKGTNPRYRAWCKYTTAIKAHCSANSSCNNRELISLFPYVFHYPLFYIYFSMFHMHFLPFSKRGVCGGQVRHTANLNQWPTSVLQQKNLMWPVEHFPHRLQFSKTVYVKMLTGHLQMQAWSIISFCIVHFYSMKV